MSDSWNGAGETQAAAPSASELAAMVGAILGLPGRATGGPVSPGQAYLVGEQGPELFVPSSAGSITPNSQIGGGARNVNVAISVQTPAGGDAAQSLQRSTRQIASAVRRALTQS
jgi:phage-related minor tail protein